MSDRYRKPSWWILIAIPVVMVLVMGGEHFVRLPGVSYTVFDAGVVILGFLGMIAWLQVNGGSLERYEFDKHARLRNIKLTVYETTTEDAEEHELLSDEGLSTLEHEKAPADRTRDARNKESGEWFLN